MSHEMLSQVLSQMLSQTSIPLLSQMLRFSDPCPPPHPSLQPYSVIGFGFQSCYRQAVLRASLRINKQHNDATPSYKQLEERTSCHIESHLWCVVAMVKPAPPRPPLTRVSRRATPRADPSRGSVPVPTSSSSTSDRLSDAALTACTGNYCFELP